MGIVDRSLGCGPPLRGPLGEGLLSEGLLIW